MKILFLNHNQERFGTYWRCFYLAKHLSQQGHEIILICASGRNFDLLIRKKKINQNFSIITLPRIKYHRYFTGQILRLVLTLPIVLLSNYDLCHAFAVAQPQIAIPALTAKYLRGKKLIVDWDDLWGGGFAEEHASPVTKVLSFFERWIPKHADRITYVSEFLGHEIKKLGLGQKARKITNGANIDEVKLIDQTKAKQKLGLEKETKYLVSVGNTYFPQALKTLFLALEKIKQKEKVKLLMVGLVDINPEVRKIFSQIEKEVILTGSVPFEKVLVYLSAADVLVLPMENNPIEKARFPIRLGDYLASGKPIVASAVGEVKYYLEKNKAGLVNNPRSIDELAENIIKLIKNKSLSQEISQNARNLAKRELAWGKIANKLMKIY